MKTAVVILNWDTVGFLREFLPGLVRSCERVEGAEVVVADNGSADGSVEMLREEFPGVKTIVFEKNLGFTGGYNAAFEALKEAGNKIPGQARNDVKGGREKAEERGGPEYFVMINSDIEVTDGWLEPLVEWMDGHPECGACAPKLHSYQERGKFEYAGAAGGYIDRFGYPFCRGRVLGRLEEDKGQYDEPTDVMWATGACLMVRSRVFEELEGLDERFFAHMEEIDLCWRMQLHGYKVTVVPESVVYHVGGGTLPASSPFKLKLNYRNNLLMLEKNLAKTFALMEYRKEMLKQVQHDVGVTHNSVKSEPVSKKGLFCSREDEKSESVSKSGLFCSREEEERVRKAAARGCRKAARRIFVRKCLDGMAAVAYLLTGRGSSFRAVCEAHRECDSLVGSKTEVESVSEKSSSGRFSANSRRQSEWVAAEIVDYLPKAEIKGIYKKSIIFEALLKGKRVFQSIRIKDFYEI